MKSLNTLKSDRLALIQNGGHGEDTVEVFALLHVTNKCKLQLIVQLTNE